MYKTFILLGLFLFCMQDKAYACDFFTEARKATFENNIVQLSGSGTITSGAGDCKKTYHIAAQMLDASETRFRINLDNEVISLILTHGKIYDEKRIEEKVVGLFTKLVVHGLLDPFFMLEILSGERNDLYCPHMKAGPGNIVQLTLSPAESLALYSQWTSDFRSLLGAASDDMSNRELSIAKTCMEQILTALEANVQYTFHIQPDTGLITEIDIRSEFSSPEPRVCQASIKLSPKPLPSFG